MTKILMVCLGNICRSPLAHGIMEDKMRQYKLDGVVDSAGTSSYHIDSPPDPRSIKVAKENGLDISNQRGRKVHYSDLQNFDRIYAMDSSNYQDLIRLAEGDEKDKIKLIMNEVYPNKNINVPDPYYGGENGFQDVCNMLDEACEAIAKSLKTENKE